MMWTGAMREVAEGEREDKVSVFSCYSSLVSSPSARVESLSNVFLFNQPGFKFP